MVNLAGQKIIIGVCGGISAYKIAELVRLLVKEKAHVRVCMTHNATRFISPLTFEALSGNKVITDMWNEPEPDGLAHISWGQNSNLVIIAPATANIIGKAANGIADDFLSSMLVAATSPVMICPAMNTMMFRNAAVTSNINTLRQRGFHIMNPASGDLACGTTGEGRLPDPSEILEEAIMLLTPNDLAGYNILITAGPTEEPIDPVRFISNRSSGKMGCAIAKAARLRGAGVTLVAGNITAKYPHGVETIKIQTAEEMYKAVTDISHNFDIIIKAAAVADYKPTCVQAHKIKKLNKNIAIELESTKDILAALGKKKKKEGFFLVGFAAETENFIENATAKFKNKNLDMIVMNDVSKQDSGFGSDNNAVKIFNTDGIITETDTLPKDIIADIILDKIVSSLGGKKYEDTGNRRR